MNTLFGAGLSGPMTFFIAFVVVMLAIGAFALVIRRFGAGALTTVTGQRNRQQRLAVVDSTPIDNRRKLVIVRRDNTEHLLMIGGPTDVLVEANIVRAATAQPVRDSAPQRQAAPEPAITPLDAAGWPLAPTAEPIAARAEPAPRIEPLPKSEPIARVEPMIKPAAPVPPAAPVIPTFTPPAPPVIFTPPPAAMPPAAALAPEVSIAAAPLPQPVQDAQIVNLAAALQEPLAPVEATAPQAPPSPTAEEQNLQEMALRLEAALRRPATPAPAAPAPAPSAPSVVAVPPRPAPIAPAPPAAVQRPRVTPTAPPAPPRQPATSYESLQREMANLLGRQSGTS